MSSKKVKELRKWEKQNPNVPNWIKDNPPRFECQKGCTDCCEPPVEGYIFYSDFDLIRISKVAGMLPSEFANKYLTYQHPVQNDKWRAEGFWFMIISPEKPCLFLDQGVGCRIQKDKPMQCRSYPHWKRPMRSKEYWDAQQEKCPGINKGPRVKTEEVSQVMTANKDNPFNIK